MHGIATSNCDLAQKGVNKENTVNPGPWTKPKKTRSKAPKPVSTVDFEGFLHLLTYLLIILRIYNTEVDENIFRYE